MHVVYWLANELVAVRKFESLQKLINLLSNNRRLEKFQHNSDYSFHQFIKHLYEADKADIMRHVHAFPWYSVLVDETTDNEHISQIAFWAKHRDLTGKVKMTFLGLVQAGKAGCTGQALYDRLMEMLKVCDLNLYNMVGLATDGASAMRGDYTGLVGLLKQELPWLVAVHCAAHRLHLVAVDLLKDADGPFAGALKAENLCKSVTAFFNSDKRTIRLLEVQDSADLKEKVFSKSVETRWLSEKMVLDNVYNNYTVLPGLLLKLADEAAKDGHVPRGMAAELAELKFVENLATLKVVKDLMQPVQIALQEDTLSPLAISPMINKLTADLQAAVDSDKVLEHMEKLLQSVCVCGPCVSVNACVHVHFCINFFFR
jgi:hypothetical protein